MQKGIASECHPQLNVSINDRIADVSKLVFDSQLPVQVTDSSGHVCGSVDRDSIVEFMVTSGNDG